ncbi:hypothetical protein KBD33_00810 [Candidatus Gracilibacteria bacterium]|nr:hypothetical protein [Candidatus Gracilibacteria bacterium]
MANLSSVQIQIDIMNSKDEFQKKKVLEPQNIQEVRAFIAEKKGKPGWEIHEKSFKDWEDLVTKFEGEKGSVVAQTAEAVSSTPRSYNVTVNEDIPIVNELGQSFNNEFIPKGSSITLTIPENGKVVVIQGGKLQITEVQMSGGRKIFIPKSFLDSYMPQAQKPVEGPMNVEQHREKFAKIKEELDSKLKSPATGADVLADCELVRELKDPVARMYAVNWIVGNIIRSGFQVTLTGDKVDIVAINTKDLVQTAKAAELERALSSSLSSKSIGQSDIAQAILIGSGEKWTKYVQSTANGIPVTTEGYTQHLLEIYKITGKENKDKLRQVQNNKAIPSEEKAYLISSLSGGMASINIAQTMQTYTQGVQVGTDLFMTDAYRAIARVTGGTIPATPVEARRQAEAILANPASAREADGKPISWLLGGILAIFGLGYSKAGGFSFWTGLKRAFIGVIAVVGGCAVGREWKKELGYDLCDEAMKMMKDTMGQGREALAGAIGAAGAALPRQIKPGSSGPSDSADVPPERTPNKPSTPAETSNLTQSQSLASKSVLENQDIKKSFEGQTQGAQEYLNLIHKELSTVSMEKLVTDDDKSIFSPSPVLDESIVSKIGKLSKIRLKKVLRVYLGSTANFAPVAPGAQPGQKEKEEFMNKMKEKGLNADAFKNKTLSDGVSTLYNEAPRGGNDTARKSSEILKKVHDYQLVVDGKVKSKENLGITIEEYQDNGVDSYGAIIQIKDFKDINPMITYIKPITIYFDKDGNLETQSITFETNISPDVMAKFGKSPVRTLKQEGNQIHLLEA